MILGMTLSTFSLVHVVISLIGIGSGLLVMYGLLIGIIRPDPYSRPHRSRAVFQRPQRSVLRSQGAGRQGLASPAGFVLAPGNAGWAQSKKFDVPTLILHGDDDQIVPIGASAPLSSKIVKGATLKIYPGAPHGICSTLKDQVNSELLGFFKRSKQVAA
jgi:pimeloyl-ACP methyl ester carboxylesterase